jgi:phosphate transport system permease protein
MEPAAPVVACAFTPKGDGIVAATATGFGHWRVDEPHADASLAALFSQAWYEGYPAPEHVWQSSSGTDDFEAKLGLWPLIFGSCKATLFCMLFGVPIALLAAIYTSEFMHPRARAIVKPTIELMASLPSVVLGFLAALVIAPFVEDIVPAVLALAVTVPVALLVGAWGWQALPPERQAAWDRWRPACLAIAVPVGVVAAFVLGPALERACIAGDLRLWLDRQSGGSAGGWFVVWLPLAAVAAVLAVRQWVTPWLRRRSHGWSRGRVVAALGAKLAIGLALTAGTALVAAGACAALGLDTRGTLVGTYVQRNALVVGFVMGFAIIPIVYTIAEDALSTVPNHLRLASLGAGATPWQTAVRVVIPTAMSGLFSAIMIGLGRAVGETMIVLMAAGNTPVMEWNVFNGFRTLSATIAVELPEAVRDSTHYRTLFLSALTLLVLTSVLNTAAELVRLRFRRRAGAL